MDANLFTDERELYGDEEFMTLIDLDRDSIPEFIQGRSYRTVNSVEEILTIRDGQVIQLKDKHPLETYYEGNYKVGMSAFLTDYDYAGIKLLYNSQNGRYKYVSEDTSSSVDGAYIPTYEIDISGSTLITNLVSYANYIDEDKLELEGFEEQFKVRGQEVSKAQYESYMQSYYKGWVEVPHGGVTAKLDTVYAMFDNVVDYNALHAFFNSYGSSEAVRLNQTPAGWAQAEVDEALKLQLVPEELRRAFANSINRQEFSQLIMQFLAVKLNVASDQLPATYGKTIDDTSFDDTSNRDVLAAQALGIVSGKGDRTFDPDGYITRQEAAVMLSRVATLLDLNTDTTQAAFKDGSQIAGWAKGAVSFVVAAKDSTNNTSVMGGTGDNQFSPASLYSRQQAIITVKRLLNVKLT